MMLKGRPSLHVTTSIIQTNTYQTLNEKRYTKVDPDVLEQLLQQPLQEEEQPQQNLVDVDSQKTSLQELELEQIDPEDLLDLMVEYLLTDPEDLVKVEEEVKKAYPAIMGEITKNKSAILPLCRKLLHQARNRR